MAPVVVEVRIVNLDVSTPYKLNNDAIRGLIGFKVGILHVHIPTHYTKNIADLAPISNDFQTIELKLAYRVADKEIIRTS